MRIAFIIAALGAGGAERVISLIANDWATKGWQVTVIAFDDPADPVYHHFHPSIELVRLNLSPASGRRLSGVWLNLQRVFALRRSLKRLRPDVAVSFLTKINVLALLASRGMTLPVIVSERNNPRRQAAHPLWAQILAKLYPRADAIVMQTRDSLECLPPSARARAHVIPNPVSAPATAAPGDRPTVIAGVGRLIPQKGFDLLIRAFATVAGQFPQWDLVIWGEGDERTRLQALTDEHGLQGRISLPGLSPRPGSWIEETGVFILSSRFEGFPNVLAEAMAAGLPVIAFDCAYGPHDLIIPGQNGILVPPEDVALLATAMTDLLSRRQLQAQLGSAAKMDARRFLPDEIIGRWTALVELFQAGTASTNPNKL